MGYEERDTDGAKVLIVDDLEINRVMLEDIIAEMGWHPVLAEVYFKFSDQKRA